MRRLGAVLPAIEAAGVQAVCVLPEDFQGEPADFAPEYWDRDLFLDESLALFAAAGGGRVRRGSLLDLLNPRSHFWRVTAAAVKRAAAAGVKGNQKGGLAQKTLKGGLLLLTPAGEVAYRFTEEEFGDRADPQDVLAACQAWAARQT